IERRAVRVGTEERASPVGPVDVDPGQTDAGLADAAEAEADAEADAAERAWGGAVPEHPVTQLAHGQQPHTGAKLVLRPNTRATPVVPPEHAGAGGRKGEPGHPVPAAKDAEPHHPVSRRSAQGAAATNTQDASPTIDGHDRSGVGTPTDPGDGGPARDGRPRRRAHGGPRDVEGVGRESRAVSP